MKATKGNWERFDAMTDDERRAAALDDPDARPLTPEDMPQLRPVNRTRIIRRALGLTQEEFATRYHIPLGTLRDWEQGRKEPDQAAKSYLSVIAVEPETVRRLLERAIACEHHC